MAATQDRVAKKSLERHHHDNDGRKCPFCGADIDSRYEICPDCGGKLVSYCTFCGADMERGETECPECGMPAGGIKCPECGAHNYRSFCSKCNTPLTRAAQKSVQRALEDPKVQKAIELCNRIAELEEELGEELDEEPGDVPGGGEELTEGARRMMEIMGKVRPGLPAHAKESRPVVKNTDRTSKKEEYRKTVRDINKLFEEMLPPAGTTPQEQRNFYSARKVAVVTTIKKKVKVPIEWICNYCGCHHNQPSECAEPQLGGTWVYIEKTETTTIKEYKYQ